MGRILVIGEDVLCCALGTRLVEEVLGWELAQEPINSNGITKLVSALPRYVGIAKIHPVLCIADADRQCVIVLLQKWLPGRRPEKFIFRLAVPEAESWLLADPEGLAEFFCIAPKHVPKSPDCIDDPKQAMLALARKSRRRYIKQEVVNERDSNKPGNGYNTHLSEFVRNHWDPEAARVRSPSLNRAVQRLQELAGASG